MDNESPKKYGPYEIVERLGRGGMSVVYRAYQPSMKREVAIKVLKTNLAEEPGFMKRFNREVEVITRLEHPHVLPVIDYGSTESDVYLVMRLVDGGSLADKIKEGPFALEAANRTLCEVASALDYAHRCGVIHRDLKPPNILLDQDGNAYLTDFGIAKLINVESVLTATDQVMGTPAYMSPEQGLGLGVDERTDIYALGLILYEMLTGHRPFEGDNPSALIFQHVYEPVLPPSTIAPEIPPAVDAVVLRALDKEPDMRYQTPHSFSDAFTQAIMPTLSTLVTRLPTEETPVIPRDSIDAQRIPTEMDAQTPSPVREDTVEIETRETVAEQGAVTIPLERAIRRKRNTRRFYLASLLLILVGVVFLFGANSSPGTAEPTIDPDATEIEVRPARETNVCDRPETEPCASVEVGQKLIAVGRDTTGAWIRVRVHDTGRWGWVSAADLDAAPGTMDSLPLRHTP